MLFSEWKKLYEARRNPEKNPKISTYKAIEPYFDKENIYMSFTSIDKLGIKPGYKFNTPLGIYSYPIKDLKESDTTRDWDLYKSIDVPFAGDRDFIWVFKAKNPDKVLEISEYDSADWDEDIKNLYTYLKKYNIEKDVLNEIIQDMYEEARVKNPGGYFWYVTMMLSEYIEMVSRDVTKSSKSKRKKAVVWNEIFRYLGYDGITDKKGQGIIHTAEPIQAVFFSKSAIEEIEKVRNNVTDMGEVVEEEIKIPTFDFSPGKKQLRKVISNLVIEFKSLRKVANFFILKLNKIERGYNISDVRLRPFNIMMAIKEIKKVIKKYKLEIEDLYIYHEINYNNALEYFILEHDFQFLEDVKKLKENKIDDFAYGILLRKIKEYYENKKELDETEESVYEKIKELRK